MEQIERGIYVENNYPGVTLGALALSRGTILVDSPPCPDDARSWRAALRNLGSGVNRLLIFLDSHHDRTLGARTLESPVMSHTSTAEAFRGRPAVFKAQPDESGSEWEVCIGLSGVRWMPPNITFHEQASLHWDDEPVVVEHHPGPTPGASWVILPQKNVVFVGDVVIPSQPPFLAEADLVQWIEGLDLLLSAAYRNYLIVSGRGGLVATENIREQRRQLKYVLKRMETLAGRDAHPEATESMIKTMLSKLSYPKDRHDLYVQRLRYGLFHYYVRHYRPNAVPEEA